MITEITKDNFDSEVLKSEKPVLIDFFAVWCGPCRMLSPILEELAEENEDIKVCKINIDNEPELADEFEVMSIPTVAAMKDGKLLSVSVGMRSKKDFLSMLGK